MAYVVGEENLFDSTFYGTDLFKERFCHLCGTNAFIKIQCNLDKILDVEEKIIKLNQKLLEDNCEGMKAQRVANKIAKLKEKLKNTYFSTQDLIYTSYFDTQFTQITTTADIDSYRFRLYNYKNYIGITEDYSNFNEYYINKMIDLDTKYESIMNNTAVAVISNSTLATFFRKVKAILTAKIELN